MDSGMISRLEHRIWDFPIYLLSLPVECYFCVRVPGIPGTQKYPVQTGLKPVYVMYEYVCILVTRIMVLD